MYFPPVPPPKKKCIYSYLTFSVHSINCIRVKSIHKLRTSIFLDGNIWEDILTVLSPIVKVGKKSGVTNNDPVGILFLFMFICQSHWN